MKKMIDIDLIVRKPISEEDLIRLLSKSSYRNEFINEYTFFKTDGHSKIYQNFIESTDFSKNNDRIEDAIVLADSIDYFSNSVLDLIRNILFSRKNYFLKLTCLDYTLSQNEKIDRSIYVILNERYKNNKNEFLKLQANINLLIIEDKSKKSIIKVLKLASYPNIFFRFFNSISFNISSFKNHVDSVLIHKIVEIFESHDFSIENRDYVREISLKIIKELES